MSTITHELVSIGRAGHKCFEFRIDGHPFCSLTQATGVPAAARLQALCETHADALLAAVLAANAKREWNFTHPGQGRDWPEFRALDSLIDSLLRQAGIKDS